MSPIPGEPLEPKAPELTTSDGRRFKLKLPGVAPPPGPEESGEGGEPGSADAEPDDG